VVIQWEEEVVIQWEEEVAIQLEVEVYFRQQQLVEHQMGVQLVR
jgi:hypothetical protein